MNQEPRLPGVYRPPLSLAIIGVCGAIYLMLNVLNLAPQFWAGLALWPMEGGRFGPWQLVSYGFLHGSFNHIFFNMFALWMFGLQIERVWGSQRFATYYLACIIGAAIAQLVVQQVTGSSWPTIGASGAVFGLLLAYGVMWPENRIFLLFLPVPIKAKWFVLIYGAVELFFGITNAMPQVAHFAHLGGLFFGAGLLWKWGWRPGMTWKF